VHARRTFKSVVERFHNEKMMTNEELKQAIIQYIKKRYERDKEAPSLRKIIEHFKKEKLNFTRFYKMFPGGIPEAYRLAGVPIPKDRMRRTAKATKAVKTAKAREKAEDEAPPPTRLVLTEEQSKRLLGISHLEGGKDPLVIIDELLDYDSKARKYGLSLARRKLLSEALEAAMEKGWKVDAEPSFVEALTRAHNLGLLNWTPETVKYMLDVLEWARIKKWSPLEFANYVTRHCNELSAYLAYLRGEISYERFKEVMRSYVRG